MFLSCFRVLSIIVILLLIEMVQIAETFTTAYNESKPFNTTKRNINIRTMKNNTNQIEYFLTHSFIYPEVNVEEFKRRRLKEESSNISNSSFEIEALDMFVAMEKLIKVKILNEFHLHNVIVPSVDETRDILRMKTTAFLSHINMSLGDQNISHVSSPGINSSNTSFARRLRASVHRGGGTTLAIFGKRFKG